jgi:hypothetical protein
LVVNLPEYTAREGVVLTYDSKKMQNKDEISQLTLRIIMAVHSAPAFAPAFEHVAAIAEGACSSFRSVRQRCSILITASFLINPFALVSLWAWRLEVFLVLPVFHNSRLRHGIFIFVSVRGMPEDNRGNGREDEDDGGSLHVGTEKVTEDVAGES